MADIIPLIFPKDQAEKKVDFINDSMRLALLSGTYDEVSLKQKTSYNELVSYEISPNYGYTTGGIIVGGKTVTIDVTDNSVIYDVDDIGMTVNGGTLGPTRYGVIYNVSNSNNLVYIFDFGEDKTVNDGADFKIKIDSDGLLRAKPK